MVCHNASPPVRYQPGSGHRPYHPAPKVRQRSARNTGGRTDDPTSAGTTAGRRTTPQPPPAAGIVLTRSPRRPGEILLTPAGPRSQVRIAQTEPPDSTDGRLAPARPATPAASLGQPGILPAHHSRLLRAAQRTRRPATSAGKQQLSRRAEGPVRRDVSPWRTLPRHGWTDQDERAQGRRGATGPDPRTAQSRSARSGGGSSRRILPGIGSRPSPRRRERRAGHMYAVGPVSIQDSRIRVASVLSRKRADSRAERPDARAVMTAESTAVCDQQTQRAQAGPSGAAPRLTDGRCPQKAGGRLRAVRADLPGLCRRHRRCVRPQIPGLSPGGLGPHLTSSGFPCGLSSGFPFARRVPPRRPPSSGFPPSGVLRFVSLRPLPGSGSPSVSLRVPFP